MVGFRIERPGVNWLRVLSDEPIILPPELQTLPGISVREPKEAGFAWTCDVSITTWRLHDVHRFLQRYRVENPWQWRPWAARPNMTGAWRRPLLSHQWVALEHFYRSTMTEGVPGGILADQLGLGKTTTALAWAKHLAPHYPGRPCVVIGPKYLADTWTQELQAVLGEQLVRLVGTEPYDLDPQTRWFFLHYDIVHAWWSQLHRLRPYCVLLDEAHLLRNQRTRRAKGAQLAFAAAPHRMILTGTPLLNRIAEMHGLLTLLTGPWTWGSSGLFRMRYMGAYIGEYGMVDVEPSYVEELQTRLASFYLRRTEADVAVDLPSTARAVVTIDRDPGGRDEFDGYAVEDIVQAILGRRATTQTFTWLMRLRKRSARRKIPRTLELAQNVLEQGLSCVVFCWQRETCEKIAGRLPHATFVHGGLSQAERDGRVQALQCGAARVLVATYDSLGVGVTLNRARVAILHDLDFVPATMLQAEGRVTGGLRRKAPTQAIFVQDPSGIDPIILRLLQIKGHLIQEVTTDMRAAEVADMLAREL